MKLHEINRGIRFVYANKGCIRDSASVSSGDALLLISCGLIHARRVRLFRLFVVIEKCRS